ncbi:hypothetical protein J3R82DRAFT_2180 [Butyriboletus roseoflavus]|nr:hypothetical protein J3R82DRAFT_2180 [Butyriboletus roseoflavus]
MAWIVDCFYKRGNWKFALSEEWLEYFTKLIFNFETRWPVKVLVFPDIPEEVDLSKQQKDEMKKIWGDFYVVSAVLHTSQMQLTYLSTCGNFGGGLHSI